MSRDKLLDALKNSVPSKNIKELRNKNRDDDKIIRDLRALYEPEKDHYEPQKLKGAFDDEYIEYESNGDKNKTSIEEYLNVIRPYLSNMIDNHEDEWKIQLTMEVSFVSTVKDSNKPFAIHIHSKNSEVYIGYKTAKIIKELFKSLLEEYQESLKTKMKTCNLALDSVDALYYKLHKVSLDRGGSYVDSPEWAKSKKATINSKNKKDVNAFNMP